LMTNKIAAFGASQPGRRKSALFTHKGYGSALLGEPISGRIWAVPSPIWGMSVCRDFRHRLQSSIDRHQRRRSAALTFVPSNKCRR
jgi:hypothetical protein